MSIRGREHLPPNGQYYVFPNDITETQRLNLQHDGLKTILGGNVLAPITTPQRILDVGCGTGVWCIELATEYPAAEVIGIDLVAPRTPGTPLRRTLPANYHFQLGNILDGLPFPNGHFDYVHMRTITPGIPAASWQGVFHELARVTAPRGWIESIEVTTPEQCGPVLRQIFTMMEDAIAMKGVDLAVNAHMHLYMQNAGLTAITTRAAALPLGTYGGTMGRFWGNDYITGVISFGDYLVKQQIVDATTFDALIQHALHELQDEAIRAVAPCHIACGQQPLA